VNVRSGQRGRPAVAHAARIACRGLLAVSLGMAGTPSLADVRHTRETTYYDVTGSTARELRDQIEQLRPRGDDGGRYDAYTRWRLEWRYMYRETRDACRLASFKVTLRTTIHLPRWQAPPGAAADLEARWNAYVDALDRHEQQHEAIAVEAAETIEREVSAIDRAPDCATLEARVNARAEALMEDYKARQRDFDMQTAHGRNEGVKRP